MKEYFFDFLTFRKNTCQLPGLGRLSTQAATRCLRSAALILLALLVPFVSFGQAQKLFPANARLVNVKTEFGAVGDGTTDDTQAILRAIQAHVGTDRILYFPTGTYVVSNTLPWRKADGTWQAHLMLQGQSQTSTVIRLKDNAPGFQDPNNPKPVVLTASHAGIGDQTNGGGNNAFNNSLYDLTISTGRGNGGAVALDYLASNVGSVRDVTLRSEDGTGKAGLALTHNWPGPCLIKRVTIEGFDYGVLTGHYQYGITFEYLTLHNQKVAGIQNEVNLLHLRKVTSINAVPAVRNSGGLGLITILDSDLQGGSSGVSAIEINDGQLYARNITTGGYQSAIRNRGTALPGATVGEYATQRLDGSALNQSWSLPIEETPEPVHDNNFGTWANVEDFNPDPYDQTDAIQRAIDSGAETVYFPKRTYYIRKPILVRGNVRRLLGLWSAFHAAGVPEADNSFKDPNSPQPMFRVVDGTAPVVTMEQMTFAWTIKGIKIDGTVCVEHASARTLVLRQLGSSIPATAFYRNQAGAGKLFIEDVAGSPWRFTHSQQVWARQFNPEYDRGGPMVAKSGGTFWVLGLKTEGQATVLQGVNGAQTEILGGLLYPLGQLLDTQPAFDFTDSPFKLTVRGTNSDYPLLVRETWNGTTYTLQAPELTGGQLVPFYLSTGPRPGTGTGLKAEYFDNGDFTNLKTTRTDKTVNFDWLVWTPAGTTLTSADSYSARWTGFVQAPVTGNVTFHLGADDGATLWLNNQAVPLSNGSATVALAAGQLVPIRLNYQEGSGNAWVRLEWSYEGSSTRQVVPQNRLYPSQPTTPSTATSGAPIGQTIYLRAVANGRYVCAENAGAAPLIARRTAVGSWEQFVVEDAGGGKVALRAVANGRYVCAESGGAAALIANRTAVGGWERFEWLDAGNGTVALRAEANGRYVCAEGGGASSLIANRTAVGGWEQFQWGAVAARAASVVASAVEAKPGSATLPLTAADLTAYPNPARDFLHVALPAAASGATATLTDLLGRAVLRQPLSGGRPGRLDVRRLPAGTYLLRVEQPGHATRSQRVVVAGSE